MFASRTLAIAVVAILALASAHGLSQNPKKEQKDKPDALPLPNEAQVMQVKLQRFQALLEAITREDYKAMEANASSLARIVEMTAFLRAYKTEEYEVQARAFKRAAVTLAAKAEDKNLDGATLAYLDMTMGCVKCHNHFRGKKRD
jgi:hypothetical protein